MIAVTVRGAEAVAAKLGLAARDVGVPGMRAAMGRAVKLVERDLKEKGLTGTKGRHPFFGVTGAAGDALGVRSGHLRRSVVSEVVVKTSPPQAVVGVVGTPQKTALVHEGGATVSGRPYLAIPLAEVQTRAGIARAGPRSFAGAFVFKSKAGNLFVGIRRGRQLVPLFMLRRSVRLRARRVFERTTERVRVPVGRLFEDAVSVAVRKAG